VERARKRRGRRQGGTRRRALSAGRRDGRRRFSASKRPTWHDGAAAVVVHPSCMLHSLLASQYTSPYLVFSEKMKTSQTYLRDVSAVSPMALLLFGGRIEVHHSAGYVLLDEWLKVRNLHCAAALFLLNLCHVLVHLCAVTRASSVQRRQQAHGRQQAPCSATSFAEVWLRRAHSGTDGFAHAQIRVAAQTAVLVKQLRLAWDALMARKVRRPTDPFDVKEQKILDTIVALVREDARAAAA
jgi:Oligonucleotide/oligosaccharide-binding (OB)-fold